jgi:hypothetical protein
MTLHYLDFDYSEDAQGVGSFEAMAATTAEQAPRVQAEVACVLDWAFDQFGNACAPLDEGGEWDYDLQGQRDTRVTQTLSYHRRTGLTVSAESAGTTWHTLTLVLSGTAAFCAAFRARFGLDDV